MMDCKNCKHPKKDHRIKYGRTDMGGVGECVQCCCVNYRED